MRRAILAAWCGAAILALAGGARGEEPSSVPPPAPWVAPAPPPSEGAVRPERIESAWLERLHHPGFLARLPAPLLRSGPAGILWWQWLALPSLLLAALLLGLFLGRLTRGALEQAAARAPEGWVSSIPSRLDGPLALGWTLALLAIAAPWIALHPPAASLLRRFLRAGFLLAFFWALLRSIDVAAALLARTPWAQERAASRSLVPLGRRVTKIALWALALVTVLSNLGFSVESLLAGLGLGGLALALAAQKTVENLFGAFSIGVDQPFHEGDFVKVGEFVGTVEAIGLRSTRIRTLDRTLVSLPNGKLADLPVESYSIRDRMRLATTLGLDYATPAPTVRKILKGLEATLRKHPKIWPGGVSVRLTALGESSLDVEVLAWFETRDWDEFLLIRQEVLLDFLEVVRRAGASLAFPTRTIHLTPGIRRPR